MKHYITCMITRVCQRHNHMTETTATNDSNSAQPWNVWPYRRHSPRGDLFKGGNGQSYLVTNVLKRMLSSNSFFCSLASTSNTKQPLESHVRKFDALWKQFMPWLQVTDLNHLHIVTSSIVQFTSIACLIKWQNILFGHQEVEYVWSSWQWPDQSMDSYGRETTKIH